MLLKHTTILFGPHNEVFNNSYLGFTPFSICSSQRNFSTNSAITPVKVYSNADVEKVKIFAENHDKAGVYRWVNKINGNTYVGSSVDIGNRLYSYYSLRSLAKSNRPIERALLKHGFSNFSLEILEYCDIKEALNREQYYLDNLKPEYNIVETAGSTLGYKHTPESLKKMRDFILSEEVRERKARPTANATASRRIPIIVENIKTLEKSEYISLVEAGKALGVSRAAVSQALLNNRLIKKTYSITKKS
jgi:hypothetical protein